MRKREDLERALTALLHREPFRPFVIELDHGERLVVGERTALHHHAGSAVFFRPNGYFTFVDPEDVKQLLDLEVVQPS